MNLLPLDALRQIVDTGVLPYLQKMLPYAELGPRVEVRQTPQEIVVTAEIPGIENPNDLHIHVQEPSITISGELQKQEQQQVGYDLMHTERVYGKFSRTVPLPVLVDPKQVRAQYKNGLLTVTMQKNTQLQGRRVQVDFLDHGNKIQ